MKLERYCPINTEENLKLYNKYKSYAREKDPNVIFCGRIGGYEYNKYRCRYKRSNIFGKELAVNNKI